MTRSVMLEALGLALTVALLVIGVCAIGYGF